MFVSCFRKRRGNFKVFCGALDCRVSWTPTGAHSGKVPRPPAVVDSSTVLAFNEAEVRRSRASSGEVAARASVEARLAAAFYKVSNSIEGFR